MVKIKKCSMNGCFSDAVCRDGKCAAHTRGVRNKHSYAGHTKPKNLEHHIGVEIECIARDVRAHTALCAQKFIPHSDGSLPSYGCEFKLCAPATRIISRTQLLAQRIRECGGTVTRDCGLHVHIDARGVSYDRRREVLDWIQQIQPWIWALMPLSRRENGYARPTITSNHYSWFHQTPYETIECRIHGSTLNPHKLSGWLSVMIDIQRWMYRETGDHDITGHPVYAHLPPWTFNTGSINPTISALESAFPTPLGREYLLARQSAGGHLDAFEVSNENCA